MDAVDLPSLDRVEERLAGIKRAARYVALQVRVPSRPQVLLRTGACYRRRTWEAWKSNGECRGHWSALVALGARIRPCPLEDFEPYRTLKPLVRKQFPVGGPDSRGVYKTVVTDPEDEDYVPPEEPKRRRALAR